MKKSDTSPFSLKARLEKDNSIFIQISELIFFAQINLTKDTDLILADFNNYGRAHHRILHFVSRKPGITVKALRQILNVSNQATNKVLGPLVHDGMIMQENDKIDRRLRHLYLTSKGSKLLNKARAPQFHRMKKCFEQKSVSSIESFITVMEGFLNPDQLEIVATEKLTANHFINDPK